VAVQFSVLLVLVVATNTSFAGFPRLVAILASDGFLPRQLAGLGDRLVFNNGILLLAIAAGALITAFGGDTHALVPLYAAGLFLAFTLSQAGMVIHWRRERTASWHLKAGVNGLGALVTGVVTIVVGTSKFIQGAWITVLLIPSLVAVFLAVRRHYRDTAEQLSLGGLAPERTLFKPLRAIIPISGVHRGDAGAVDFARSISEQVTAVYIELKPGDGDRIREKWMKLWPDIPIEIVPSPYRSVVGPLLNFLDETDTRHDDGQLAVVVLPEFVPAKWWQGLLHNQTAWLIKAALLYRQRKRGYQRAIVDVPYHLNR
jgi:hypothetical protein